MRNHASSARGVGPRRIRGLSLVELMLALVLGLLVVGAAGSVFIANKRVYAASETINRIQENGRVSFELMARDVREAGGSPCGRGSQMVNMLNNAGSGWWTTYSNGLMGYDGGNGDKAGGGTAPVTGAVAGTDAIDLFVGNGSGDYTITDQSTPSSEVRISSTAGLADNDIVMACNTSYSVIFQITQVQAAAGKIQHNGGGGTTPGNCVGEFQHKNPTKCAGASNPYGYCFTKKTSAQCDKDSVMPAVLVKLGGIRWYVADNNRGSRSLYRAQVMDRSTTGTPTISGIEEIAEGIADLQIGYRTAGTTNYVAASAVADWRTVVAARIRVVSEAAEGALTGRNLQGTDGKALQREFVHVVALRNREGI